MAKWKFDSSTCDFTGDSLYFIQEGDDGPIKIGRGNTNDRLRRLQTGNPRQLHLLGEIEGGGYSEALWHHLFSLCRLKGEWFEPRKDLLLALRLAIKGEHWTHKVWFDGLSENADVGGALLDAYEIYMDMVFAGESESAAAEESVAIALNHLEEVENENREIELRNASAVSRIHLAST